MITIKYIFEETNDLHEINKHDKYSIFYLKFCFLYILLKLF